MKKFLVILIVIVIVFSLFPSVAFADLILPPDEPDDLPEPGSEAEEDNNSILVPLLAITVAVLIAAFVLWRLLRKNA